MNEKIREIENILEPFYTHTVTKEGTGKEIVKELSSLLTPSVDLDKVKEEAFRYMLKWIYFEKRGVVSIGGEPIPFHDLLDDFYTNLETHLQPQPQSVSEGGLWKPFNTAPKDREILVVYPHQMNTVLLVRYNHVHKYWQSKGEPKLGIENQDCLWTDIPKTKPTKDSSNKLNESEEK
jgi:hypothetical protein